MMYEISVGWKTEKKKEKKVKLLSILPERKKKKREIGKEKNYVFHV